MQYRTLGRTGWKVSAISFGAWAIGGTWGPVEDQESLSALHKAVDLGVNFFDTADVYGNGRSERLLAKLRKERKEHIIIATKAGRRLDPHTADGYTRANLGMFVERSLRNLGVETIDLLQPGHKVYTGADLDGMSDEVLTREIEGVDVGRAVYGLILDEEGHIIDDVIVYHWREDEYLMVPNAATTDRVLA